MASARVGTDRLSEKELASWEQGMVLAVDIEAMAELPGVVVMAKCDITSPLVHQRICQFMAGRKADVVMSDMAPNATGVHEMDHQRIMVS